MITEALASVPIARVRERQRANERSAAARSAAAFATLFAFAIGAAGAATTDSARADDTSSPSPVARPAPADCSLVDERRASEIVGFDLAAAERASRAAGICFFPSRSVSQEGSASYAIVTNASLPQLRPYFAYLARRCGIVSHGASARASLCATYTRVARAVDIAEYFAARTDLPGAASVTGLGERAFAADGCIFVATGGRVVETIVRRDGAFDLDRSTSLARGLLAAISLAAASSALPPR